MKIRLNEIRVLHALGTVCVGLQESYDAVFYFGRANELIEKSTDVDKVAQDPFVKSLWIDICDNLVDLNRDIKKIDEKKKFEEKVKLLKSSS